MKILWVALMVGGSGGLAYSQTSGAPMGTVAATDASVTAPAAGVVAVSNGRARVVGGSTVTANPGRNAEVTLTRGGSVLVCQTSGLHVAGSGAPGKDGGALLLALDRGAMEIRMKAAADDAVMTPDLRFTMAGGGPLDLRVRVSFNGDTCVENRGHKAPTLRLTDAFGETSYEVKPGQHVLFEHGSLREVVDRETTPCGCPPAETTSVSIAEAVLQGGQTKVSPKDAEAAHPFPAAVSEGLAPPAPIPAETPAGGTHVQVATALTYDPSAPRTDDASGGTTSASASASPNSGPSQVSAAQPETQKHGPIAAIGRFFKRIFVR